MCLQTNRFEYFTKYICIEFTVEILMFFSICALVKNFIMNSTPTVEKKRKSMKTASKKLNATPKMESKEEVGSRLSLRRAKLDMISVASPLNVAPFYTPGRTTRSMLKVTSNDAVSSLVTPSKRKTIASAKESTSARDVANKDGGDSNTFVRPLPPKTKRVEKIQVDSTVVNEIPTISESADASSDAEVKKSRKRARKAAKMNSNPTETKDGQIDATEKRTSRRTKRMKEADAPESSEEDWPSVSILGSTETPIGQFVRTRKALLNNVSAVESGDEDFASVSQLGLNTSGRFVRSRKTKQDLSDNIASSEDDLPSVSILGESETPSGKFVRPRKSKLSIEPKIETVSEAIVPMSSKPTPNKRTGGTPRLRKSNQAIEEAADPKANELPTTEIADIPKKNRISGQFVRSRKSLEQNKIENENNMDIEVELNKDETKEQLANDENGSTNVDSANEMAIDEDNQVNGNNLPSIKVSAAESDASANSNVNDEIEKIKIKKVLINNRVSVIDLTDSPMVQNKSALNETFTPKKEEKEEDEEANDRTFTEDNNVTAICDKTFSPLPSSGKKGAKMIASTPAPTKKDRNSLNVTATSAAKKKSPQLKRLQNTSYLKPKTRNNLTQSGKMSSAKKAKVVEAAIKLIEPLKRKSTDKLKPPQVDFQSPKVFKFGEASDQQNNQTHDFRFSLCAAHLKNGNETSKHIHFNWIFSEIITKFILFSSLIGKSGVKRAPNFSQLHNRMFNKIESIAETRDRHDQRAKLLLSGKKPTQAQAPAQGKNSFNNKSNELENF